MSVYFQEIKKLLLLKFLWVFIALCLTLNIIIIFTQYDTGYTTYVSNKAKDLGTEVNDNFISELHKSNEGEYYNRLAYEAEGLNDVFLNYDIQPVAEIYINFLQLKGYAAQLMRNKYTYYQKYIDEKSLNRDSYSLYVAGDTGEVHWFTFSKLLQYVLLEGIILAILITLYMIGYEHMTGTEEAVYSTSIGRGIVRHKINISIIAGMLLYILLAVITIIIYYTKYDLWYVLSSNVSSGFNYMSDLAAGIRPYVTWYSFSVLSYTIAHIIVSCGLIICLILVSYIIGLNIKNTYIGFMVAIIVNTLMIVIPSIVGSYNIVAYAFMLLPINLSLNPHLWFTDGSYTQIFSHFEILGVLLSLSIFLLVSCLSELQFRKRDI